MRKVQVLVIGLALVTAATSSARAVLVDYKYNATNQHVYARTDTSVSWAAAEAQAVAAGAHLVTIDDAAENTWVSTNYGSRWIGFTDQAVEGTWVWSSGTGGTFDYTTWSGTSYHHWANPNDGGTGGEPNNSGGVEHFAQMSTGGFWNDLSTQTLGGTVEFSNTIANTGITGLRYSPVTNK